MEFIVTRTSSYLNNNASDKERLKEIGLPCEFGAKVKTIKWKKVDKRKEKVVVVELNGLEDLLKLKEKVGKDLIITTHMFEKLLEIEIYDSWRE